MRLEDGVLAARPRGRMPSGSCFTRSARAWLGSSGPEAIVATLPAFVARVGLFRQCAPDAIEAEAGRAMSPRHRERHFESS